MLKLTSGGSVVVMPLQAGASWIRASSICFVDSAFSVPSPDGIENKFWFWFLCAKFWSAACIHC